MSGIKKDREVLKKRFLKGMYPTEDDFADVFESYVHKDDEIINNKADKTALEKFAKETEGVLEVVRNEDGTVNKTVIQDLTKRIEDAEEILTILGKQDGETVSELAERFSALSGSYATVYAFVSKVKAFLESADASDETINRWQEIESFLQGITDKKTLTGLLESLKTEIMQSVPKGKFMKLVDDLDAYTDASDGEIVKYNGQTNEKYTRGFDYERVAGEEILLQEYDEYIEQTEDLPFTEDVILTKGVYKLYHSPLWNKAICCHSCDNRAVVYGVSKEVMTSGDVVSREILNRETGSYELYLYTVSQIEDDSFTAVSKDGECITVKFGSEFINTSTLVCNGIEMYVCSTNMGAFKKDGHYYTIAKIPGFIAKIKTANKTMTIGQPSSWQYLPSSPVIY